MNDDPVKELLKQALPRMEEDGPPRDLWPRVLRGIEEPAANQPAAVAWFDWALLAGLVGFVFLVPASIPVFLYYL